MKTTLSLLLAVAFTALAFAERHQIDIPIEAPDDGKRAELLTSLAALVLETPAWFEYKANSSLKWRRGYLRKKMCGEQCTLSATKIVDDQKSKSMHGRKNHSLSKSKSTFNPMSH